MLELIPSAFVTGLSLAFSAMLGGKEEEHTVQPDSYVSGQNAAFSVESICKDKGLSIDDLNKLEKKLAILRSSGHNATGYDWKFNKQGDSVVASKMYEY